jgi:hypothetical protein
MPQLAEMKTVFGARVTAYWESGQVKVQIGSAAAYNAFALAAEPGSLQIYKDAAGDWWISYPDATTGLPVRYVCRNRATWALV